ncbi:hypothetical protein, partial [Enterococcus faecalis]|uniref:hypothetical protein n=1 Tax=Enterococcus faecalis TaxID=1351 RepID=UPI001C530722
DEAVLLSDRIVMLTNGPAATIGQILDVNLARPRNRVALASDPGYLAARAAVVDFLHHRHVPGGAAPQAEVPMAAVSSTAASTSAASPSAASPSAASAPLASAPVATASAAPVAAAVAATPFDGRGWQASNAPRYAAIERRGSNSR